MPRIIFDAKDFLAGGAEDDNGLQGGFSPDGKGHNIEYQKGILAPPPTLETPTDSALASGEIPFAITVFNSSGAGNTTNLVATLDASEDLNLYSLSHAGALTSRETDSTKNYAKDKSDAISHNANLFITSETDIGLQTNLTSATYDPDWWTTASSLTALSANHPHQIASRGDTLFITDGIYVHTITSGVGAERVLTLPTSVSGTAITNYDNRIFIATEYFYNYLTLENGGNSLYIWDGNNLTNTFDDIIPLPGKVYSMFDYNGILILFFEKYMAYWNGNRFIKIRGLDSIVYRHQVAIYNDKLYIAQEGNILVWDGNKFWYILGTANTVQAIGQMFGDDLSIGSNEIIYKQDLADFDANGKWYSRWINFPMNALVRSVTLILDEDMASGDVNTINLVDQSGDTLKTLTASFASQGAVRQAEFRNINIRCSDLQLQLNTYDNLIKRIIVEYDFTRQPIKKT